MTEQQNRIGLGIVATGRMARAFAPDLTYAPELELRAVASRRQETADEFAQRFGAAAAYDSLEALLADDSVELVYIASPHSLHHSQTLQCLNAGRHVLCEKPFAINAAQAAEMIALAREKNLFLMEAMWTRTVPSVVRLRELLAEGVIGKVSVVVAGGAFMPEFDPEAYLFRPDLGGGVLLDAGVYLVSWSSMLLGTPSRILASARLGRSGVDEHDAFVLEHPDGALASLYVSLRGKRSPDVTLVGEKGSIRLHPPLFAPQALTLTLPGAEDSTLSLPFEGNGYQFEAIEAAECIAAGKTESSLMPLEETLSIMRTMDTIRQQIGLVYPIEK